jgi:hypothetical protein
MRNTLRGILVSLLVGTLASIPAMAAPNRALGFVLQAEEAQLDGSTAVSGTNLYAGDVLGTLPRGTLRMQVARSQVYLLGSSAATLSTDSTAAVASLTAGTAGFISSQGNAVEIRALDVTVRPKTTRATHAQVTVNGPQELLVRSFQGALELELDGQVYEVPSGTAFRARIQSQNQAPQSMEASKHPARKQRNLIFLVFVGGAAAYGGMYIYHEQTESPDKP